MSSNLGGLFKEFSGYDDPKEIELVEKIAEKTRMGKIIWERTASSLVATAPGMQISFVRSSSPLEGMYGLGVGAGGWEIFSIRSQQGGDQHISEPSFIRAIHAKQTSRGCRCALLDSKQPGAGRH